MNNIDKIKNIYKPYRIVKKGKVTFIDSSSGTYIIKKENKDIFSLFSYLNNRDFSYTPKLIKKIDEDNIYLKEEEYELPLGQKIIELAKTVGLLHSKTVYFKNTSLDNYKEIKENIESNINYMNNHYKILFLESLKDTYLSPSKYLLCRNYNKILKLLNSARENLDKWYEKVKENTKIRVCVNHNNLELDHFINNDKNVLISWDNYIIDTPIIDLYILYKKDYLKYDFKIFLNEYLDIFPLNEDELLLFKILISIPYEISIYKSEMENVLESKNLISYINISEKIINDENIK